MGRLGRSCRGSLGWTFGAGVGMLGGAGWGSGNCRPRPREGRPLEGPGQRQGKRLGEPRDRRGGLNDSAPSTAREIPGWTTREALGETPGKTLGGSPGKMLGKTLGEIHVKNLSSVSFHKIVFHLALFFSTRFFNTFFNTFFNRFFT